jgi:hypothetical protein
MDGRDIVCVMPTGTVMQLSRTLLTEDRRRGQVPHLSTPCSLDARLYTSYLAFNFSYH